MSLHKDLETTTINLVSYLPNEISEIIFSDLPPTTLLSCRRVSKSWKNRIDNDDIWKSKFQDQKSWKYYNDDSKIDSWYELYKERHLLELNWKNDKFKKNKLIGHDNDIFCVKFYKDWILTGSKDCAIRIWDNETYKYLKVLGKPNPGILKEKFPRREALELTKDIDIKFHLDSVTCIDINDRYLVSGSSDGSCIVWKLPDFKPIHRLTIPTQVINYLIINGVALYNDYIVCSEVRYISIWKSSLDNFEHQPQFNLQHNLKVPGFVRSICVHNGIIYSLESSVVRSSNIETGQIIQEFRYQYIRSFTINNHYLFIGEHDKLTVRNLQTDEITKISDQLTPDLCIINDKLVTIDIDYTIRIWNIGDQKFIKEYKNLKYKRSLFSFLKICADTKRIVVVTLEDIAIYDFTEKLRKKYLKHL